MHLVGRFRSSWSYQGPSCLMSSIRPSSNIFRYLNRHIGWMKARTVNTIEPVGFSRYWPIYDTAPEFNTAKLTSRSVFTAFDTKDWMKVGGLEYSMRDEEAYPYFVAGLRQGPEILEAFRRRMSHRGVCTTSVTNDCILLIVCYGQSKSALYFNWGMPDFSMVTSSTTSLSHWIILLKPAFSWHDSTLRGIYNAAAAH